MNFSKTSLRSDSKKWGMMENLNSEDKFMEINLKRHWFMNQNYNLLISLPTGAFFFFLNFVHQLILSVKKNVSKKEILKALSISPLLPH